MLSPMQPRRLAALILCLALLPTLPAMAPGGGVPSANPLHPARLLGGETLLFQWDPDDLGITHHGSVMDRSPSGAHATAHIPAWPGGPQGFGNAFHVFPCCSNRGMSVDAPARVQVPEGDFSLSAWVYWGNYQWTRILFSFWSEGMETLEWFSASGANYVHLRYPSGQGWSYSMGSSWVPHQWHHYAVTFEDGWVRGYFDGDLVATHQHGATALPGAGGAAEWVTIGDFRHGGYTFEDARVDEFRMYDRALSQEEVRGLKDFPYRLPNLPPNADAGPDQVVPCTGPSTTVGLDARASHDPEGGPLSFAWASTDAQTLADPAAAATEATFALGAHAASVTVSDGEQSASDEVRVRVVDFSPPVLTATFPDRPGVYAGADAVRLGDAGFEEVVVVGSVEVQASATDLCSSVAGVRFQVDDGTVVVDTEAPYGFTYAPEGLGIQYRVLTIEAFDAFGNRSPPATVGLTVLATEPRLPVAPPAAPAPP